MNNVIENTNSIKQQEEWKPIPGYEGMYEISNWGRVKSYLYCNSQKTSERILVPEHTLNGYYRVTLCKDRKEKRYMIHRLVAQAFVPNPSSLTQVNHKDEDKVNNYFENLEWCDQSYNNSYGTRLQRVFEKLSKPIVQLDKKGNFLNEYKSIAEAARTTGISQSYLSNCCNHKYKHNLARGFIFMFKDEYTATQSKQDQ